MSNSRAKRLINQLIHRSSDNSRLAVQSNPPSRNAVCTHWSSSSAHFAYASHQMTVMCWEETRGAATGERCCTGQNQAQRNGTQM